TIERASRGLPFGFSSQALYLRVPQLVVAVLAVCVGEGFAPNHVVLASDTGDVAAGSDRGLADLAGSVPELLLHAPAAPNVDWQSRQLLAGCAGRSGEHQVLVEECGLRAEGNLLKARGLFGERQLVVAERERLRARHLPDENREDAADLVNLGHRQVEL